MISRTVHRVPWENFGLVEYWDLYSRLSVSSPHLLSFCWLTQDVHHSPRVPFASQFCSWENRGSSTVRWHRRVGWKCLESHSCLPEEFLYQAEMEYARLSELLMQIARLIKLDIILKNACDTDVIPHPRLLQGV